MKYNEIMSLEYMSLLTEMLVISSFAGYQTQILQLQLLYGDKEISTTHSALPMMN